MSTCKATVYPANRGSVLLTFDREPPYAFVLTPDEADALAKELPAVAAAARANERRCGTCGHRTSSGACDWSDGASAPAWLYLGRPHVAPTDHPNCHAWTKREGGQTT